MLIHPDIVIFAKLEASFMEQASHLEAEFLMQLHGAWVGKTTRPYAR